MEYTESKGAGYIEIFPSVVEEMKEKNAPKSAYEVHSYILDCHWLSEDKKIAMVYLRDMVEQNAPEEAYRLLMKSDGFLSFENSAKNQLNFLSHEYRITQLATSRKQNIHSRQ